MSSAGRAASNAEEGVDLVSAWQFMWRHRLIIAVTTLITAAAAVVLALTSTPIFRGEAVLTEVQSTRWAACRASLVNWAGSRAWPA